MPQSRAEIDKDVIFRNRGGCDQVETAADSSRPLRRDQGRSPTLRRNQEPAHQLSAIEQCIRNQGHRLHGRV
jgi:hypothetical protein